MRTFVQIPLGSEHLREFAKQGARVAITPGMNDLAFLGGVARSARSEDELKPGCLTLVKSKVLWAWRRVEADMLEAATQDFGGAGGAATNQRALVACAAQIVAENAARKGSGQGDKSLGQVRRK